MSTAPVDVVIMGGGLAGLTLALQLRRRLPDIDVLVLERTRHPVPVAAHKVGESSVEIGAHYFESVLGLKDHLDSQQLRKFGFRFFCSHARRDIDRVLEIGASRHLATPSYQLDRGVFENHLGEAVRRQGVRFLDGAVVRQFALGDEGADHHVTYEHDGITHQVAARWLVDASGRAGLIKRRLDLGQDNGHEGTAVWFRVGRRIDVNNWSSNPAWLNRCVPPDRWRSTNHLVGEGYWVWLIPLSSGSHSVGIVADARLHPTDTLNSFDKSMTWLRTHQPRLADELEGMRGDLQDFAWLRRFSYGCKQMFSSARWALTGEAGVFLDPFYSPGSDFIAIANTYITDLVARTQRGAAIEARATMYERLFQSFYDSMLSIYRDQYQIFGSPAVLPVKIIWDYTYYWGVLCQIFFQDRLTDVTALGELRDLLNASRQLNAAMQTLLRQWSARDAGVNATTLFDQADMDWFAEMNRGLTDTLDDDQFRQRIAATTAQLAALAGEIADTASIRAPGLDTAQVRQWAAQLSPASAGAMLFEMGAMRAVMARPMHA